MMKVIDLDNIQSEFEASSRLDVVVDQLHAFMQNQQIMKVRIVELKQAPTKKIRAFWHVDFDGIQGIVPFEESGLEQINQLKQFVGQEIFVLITKVVREQKTYVLASRKRALEIMSDVLFEQINEGDIRTGTIKGIGENIVYVDVGGGVTVGIEREQATYSTARKSLKRLFTIGQSVPIKILAVDKNKKTLVASITAAKKTPWETFKYSRNDVVVAEIVKITPKNVVFVEVQEGLDAIMTVQHTNDLRVGDKVQVNVTKFDKESQKFRVRFLNKLK